MVITRGISSFNGGKEWKPDLQRGTWVSGRAHLTGEKQLVTSKDRCVPLISDIKVRKMKEVFIHRRLDNFLSGINNIPLIQSSLLQQMTAVKFLNKEASAMSTFPSKFKCFIYWNMYLSIFHRNTVDFFEMYLSLESWFSLRIWKKESLED